MNISPFLSTSSPCDEVLPRVSKQLQDEGLRTVQTFDLHSAMSNTNGCSCPHHGTQACDCQMVVLLVYGAAEEPVTLILHGNRNQTWFSLADTILQNQNSQLQLKIQETLGQQKSESGR